MVDLNTQALQSKGLGASDVVNAIGNQNLILPGGTSKIGALEYDVQINGSPGNVAELNNLPIKTLNGATIYVRDVAHVRDGYPPQTNVVRSDGATWLSDDGSEVRRRLHAGHCCWRPQDVAGDLRPLSRRSLRSLRSGISRSSCVLRSVALCVRQ